MPRIHEVGGAVIRIYADDHNPPHFHVLGPGFSYVVDINRLIIVRGEAPKAHVSKVIEWAAGNQALLLAKWEEFNERS